MVALMMVLVVMVRTVVVRRETRSLVNCFAPLKASLLFRYDCMSIQLHCVLCIHI